jgi:hypothetical protein
MAKEAIDLVLESRLERGEDIRTEVGEGLRFGRLPPPSPHDTAPALAERGRGPPLSPFDPVQGGAGASFVRDLCD